MSVIFPAAPKSGKTEIKVRIAALATFLAATAGTAYLQTAAAGWVDHLPDWLQAPMAGVILAVVTFLSGRAAKSKPDYLSPSTIGAVEAWVKQRAASQRHG